MNIIESNLQWTAPLSLINVPQMIIDHHSEAAVSLIEDIDRWHKENKAGRLTEPFLCFLYPRADLTPR